MTRQRALSLGMVTVLFTHLGLALQARASDPYDLLIVTVDRFAGEANRLATWKRQLGFRTAVISQTSWGDPANSNIRSTFQTEPRLPYSTLNNNTVRQTIAPYITNNGIKYLLLIGNPSDILPVQVNHAYSTEGSFTPTRHTDLYYASTGTISDAFHFTISPAGECLTGSYADCDCAKPRPTIDQWGELTYPIRTYCSYDEYLQEIETMKQTPNFYPSVAYGRISVDTVAELTAVVDKIIGFEGNPSANANYYDRFMVASYREEGNMYIAAAKAVYNWNQGQGKTGSYFFWNATPYTDGDGFNYYPVDRSEIRAAIQAGPFFVLHRDHGNYNGWVAPEFTTTDVASLSNADKPFVFNIDCNTGKLMASTLSNRLVSQPGGGAIASVGASGMTLATTNDLLARALAYTILPGNFSGITDMNLSAIGSSPSRRIGDILNTAKVVMHASSTMPWTSMNYFEYYSLAGDPTVAVVTQLPAAITATYQNSLPLGTSSMTVSNISAPSGMITLVANGTLLARQPFTGNSATLTFNPITSPSTATLTISSYGYRPLVGQISFTAPAFNFTAVPSSIGPNRPVTLSYTIPAAYNGATVKVIEHRQWNNEVRSDYNGVPLSGATGSHSYGPIWFWTRSYFGTSRGPYTIDLQVNGVVVQSIQISFTY